MAALADRQLATELETAWRAAGDWLRRALERGGGFVRHDRRAARGVWPSRAGATPPIRSIPRLTAAALCVRTEALRNPRLPTRTRRRWRWRPCGRSPPCPAGSATAEPPWRSAGAWRTPSSRGRSRGKATGAGCRLAARLAAMGGRALRARRRARRRAALRGRPAHRRRAAHASERHPQFDAHGYHRGTVWPFDSWIGWGGLRAARRDAAAERVRTGVLRAVAALGDAPELYAVDGDGPEPLPYVCRVQAWTTGAAWALEHRWDGRVV